MRKPRIGVLIGVDGIVSLVILASDPEGRAEATKICSKLAEELFHFDQAVLAKLVGPIKADRVGMARCE